MASVGCVAIDKDDGDEPIWRPQAFVAVQDDGPCRFVWTPKGGKPVVVPCEKEKLKDYYLIPLSDNVTLKSKLQQCETWR